MTMRDEHHFHEMLRIFLDSKNPADLVALKEHSDLGRLIHAQDLRIPKSELFLALTHRSFSNEFKINHQEKLEFLGDSVLSLIISLELFARFPEDHEGQLSKRRSLIVNEFTLSQLALGLGLDKLIVLGKGEFSKKLNLQNVVLADTLEALLAQIFLHNGLDFTHQTFNRWLIDYYPNAFENSELENFDAKSTLQQKSLALYKKLPRYTSENSGDQFKVTLWINDFAVETGFFSSKKKGEKKLAADYLQKGFI
jgi:ribonuclease III